MPAPTLRESPSAATVRISVVIAATNGPECLKACLEGLERQSVQESTEVIVMDSGRDGVAEMVRRLFPRVTLLPSSERKTIPEMRAEGMKHSRGGIVSVIEDHCIPDPRWYEKILRAHQTWYGVVGGAVENDPTITRLADWAVFFCEYGRYLNPVAHGETTDIPGINASYRREFLTLIADLLEEGRCWDPVLHARLHESGVKFYSDPSIVVYHKMEFGLRYFLSQRFHYSRSFAGVRVEDRSFWKRLLFGLSCFALPLLLLTRIGVGILGKHRHLGRFLLTVPLLVLFVIVWACGEFVGYLWGPGNSLSKVD